MVRKFVTSLYFPINGSRIPGVSNANVYKSANDATSLRQTTLLAEAVVQRCYVKNIFLKISQNSQEKTCAKVSFVIKLQTAPATLLKKRLWHRCFL